MPEPHSRDTRSDARPLLLLFAGIVAVLLVALITVIAFETDLDADVWTNRDFANYWIAARLAIQGQALDLFRGQDVYFPHMQAAFGMDYPWHAWSYPPHYVLLILPFGLMAYLPAAILFEIATLTLFLHAVSLAARRINGAGALLLIPAILCNLLALQNGFLTSALMLYGLALRSRAPILAGVAIGLLTVKPQLGLLLPLLLLYERRWPALGAAVATTAVVIAISVVAFGPDAWSGYMAHTWPYQMKVMRELGGAFPHMMPSVFGATRSLGMPAESAILFHLPVAIAAFVIFCWSLFVLESAEARGFSLLFATFVISPYSVVYDLGALSVFAAQAATAERHSSPRASTQVDPVFPLFVAVCVLPLLCFVLSLKGLPAAPLVLIAGWAALIWRERAVMRSTIPAAPPTT